MFSLSGAHLLTMLRLLANLDTLTPPVTLSLTHTCTHTPSHTPTHTHEAENETKMRRCRTAADGEQESSGFLLQHHSDHFQIISKFYREFTSVL